MGSESTAKVPCQTCGTDILPRTAQKNAGRCKPCAMGTRSQIDAAKAWYLELRGKEAKSAKRQMQQRRPPRSRSDYPPCPKCKRSAAVLPVRYGFVPALTPLDELLPDGSGYSGGSCSLSPEQPAWRCGACRFSFGRLDEEQDYD